MGKSILTTKLTIHWTMQFYRWVAKNSYSTKIQLSKFKKNPKLKNYEHRKSFNVLETCYKHILKYTISQTEQNRNCICKDLYICTSSYKTFDTTIYNRTVTLKAETQLIHFLKYNLTQINPFLCHFIRCTGYI